MSVAVPGIGYEVGGYHLDAVLGEGGMGVVYAATHQVLGKKAAVKLMRPRLCTDDESVKRFFQEAVLTASIRHPGIVEIYDYGVLESGSAYIAMALLDGESLEARLKTEGALSLLDSVRISRQIAGALAAAHAAGVVHRDLKPDNVFLTTDPDVAGGERIQLLDFGIAKLLGDEETSASLTRTGTVLGTPLYMSPEQCRGKSDIDGRTDLYALGCMLYQMLCGRPPFVGDSALDVGAAHVRDEPTPITNMCQGLPSPIAILVHQLLAKSQADRPAGAAAVADTLSEFLGTIETSPLGGRARVTTSPFPLRQSSESIELAETIGVTGDDTLAEGAAPAVVGVTRTGSARHLRIAIAAGIAIVAGIGGSLYALTTTLDETELLAAEMASSGECELEPRRCREFASLVRRGDGAIANAEWADAILLDHCESGDDESCLDARDAKQRARFTLPERVSIGLEDGAVPAVAVIDYADSGVPGWLERLRNFERRHHGDVRIYVIGASSTPLSKVLAETACVFRERSAFGHFEHLRDAFVRARIREIPPPAQLAAMSGKLSGRSLERGDNGPCKRMVRRQAREIENHGVPPGGAVFVYGKRLEPPFDDAALDSLVQQALSLRADRDASRAADRSFLASSRVRADIRPVDSSGAMVDIVTYCNPTDQACWLVPHINETVAETKSAGVVTELRVISGARRPQQAVAGCVLGKLSLLPTYYEKQRSRVDDQRSLIWMTPDEMIALAIEAGADQRTVSELRARCPSEIRASEAELRAIRADLRATTFINGRPASVGSLSGIMAVVDEELAMAEKLTKRMSPSELRDLLLRHDRPFRTAIIEPPENLR